MSWQRWTADDIADICRLYPDPAIPTHTLEARFRRRIGTIKAMAHKLGLQRGYVNHWSPSEEQELQRLYIDEDIPSTEIEQRLGRTWRAICHKANALGLRRPKPNTRRVVRDYFHEINTDQKAYWLGFIAADGTVVSGPRKYQVVLDLQPRDLHWLQHFRGTIAPDVAVTPHGTRSFSICVSSQELVNDLLTLGIGPRKSNTLEWPRIPEAFAIPFLLGYFDGDGTFCPRQGRRSTQWQWSLLGTYNFLSIARDYIQKHAGVALKEPVRAHRDTSPYLYRISANGPRGPVIDRTLNTSCLGLPRKHLPCNREVADTDRPKTS